MTKRTALHQTHVAMGAKMVDFAGWHMPIQYTSQVNEHHYVRKDAGMFDVSHMTVVDMSGSDAHSFLSRLVANDIAKLTTPGKALYTCMLNLQGGVLDDLIIYLLPTTITAFRLILNAATREKDLAWINEHSKNVDITLTVRDDLSMIAVQGPNAIAKTSSLWIPEHVRAVSQLSRFEATEIDHFFVARTGYTGEDGLEILMDNAIAPIFWRALKEVGVQPIGLGARDTLRLEAGMSLYGNDLDETVNPLVSGLDWTVAMSDQREFIGRAALEKATATGLKQTFVGVMLEGAGIMRAQQPVLHNKHQVGTVTSGGFSPTLKRSIGLARIDKEALQAPIQISIREKLVPARIVPYPFVRNGKACSQ